MSTHEGASDVVLSSLPMRITQKGCEVGRQKGCEVGRDESCRAKTKELSMSGVVL